MKKKTLTWEQWLDDLAKAEGAGARLRSEGWFTLRDVHEKHPEWSNGKIQSILKGGEGRELESLKAVDIDTSGRRRPKLFYRLVSRSA